MSANRRLKLTSEISGTVRDLWLATLRLKTITACIAVCDMAQRQRVKSGNDEQEWEKMSESRDPVCILYHQLTNDYAKTRESILRYRIKIVQLKLAVSCLDDTTTPLPGPDCSGSAIQISTEGSSPDAMLDTPDVSVASGKALDTVRNLVNVRSEGEEKVCAGDKTSVGDCDLGAAIPNAAIDGVDTQHDNVGLERTVSEDSEPCLKKHRKEQVSRLTRSCGTSLLSMAKAPTAFSPPPTSSAISGEYFEEGQRCPSSLSALRNEAVGGVATHHECVGLGCSMGSSFRPRLTQRTRGHNSRIDSLQVAKCMGGHNSPTITHRVTQCMRGQNPTTESDPLVYLQGLLARPRGQKLSNLVKRLRGLREPGEFVMGRHEISDEDWLRIAHLLPGRRGGHGGVAKDNRLFMDAIYLFKQFRRVATRYEKTAKNRVSLSILARHSGM